MLTKDIVEMIFKDIVFEDVLLVQYLSTEKNGFTDNHKSHVLVFGTTSLNTGFFSGFCQ